MGVRRRPDRAPGSGTQSTFVAALIGGSVFLRSTSALAAVSVSLRTGQSASGVIIGEARGQLLPAS